MLQHNAQALTAHRGKLAALCRHRSVVMLKHNLRGLTVLQQTSDQGGPAGLMAGPEPLAGVAVEVLVEQDQIAPVRVLGEARVRPVARPPALVRQGRKIRARREASSLRDLLEIHQPAGAGRALDPQGVAVEVVVALQGLDQQVVQREPDRARASWSCRRTAACSTRRARSRPGALRRRAWKT